MMKILLFLLYCNYYGFVEAHTPISPKEWSELAGPGFATSWFRSVRGFEKKYKSKNIQDVYDNGFRNLRLRCRTGYPDYDMKRQIRELEVVVDESLKGGVVPIITWLNHRSEAEATTLQMRAYVWWWKKVATAMKGKDYRLAYNLFEEIGLEKNPGPHCKELNEIAWNKTVGEHFICPVVGGQSLRENLDKYVQWTKAAVRTIRAIDPYRIIILGSPRKTGEYLKLIPSEIYSGDKYMMAEWHIYASGPCKNYLKNGRPSKKYWEGDGSKYGKKNVDKNLYYARNWTNHTGVLTYFGAWMPQDNIEANITMEEAIAFTKYFVGQLKANGLPWTLNALEIYYNLTTCNWTKGPQEIRGMHITQTMDWSKLLSVTKSVMQAPAPAISNPVDIGKKNKKEKKRKKEKKVKNKKKSKKGEKNDFYHESIYGNAYTDDVHEITDIKDFYGHPRSPMFNREDEFFDATEVKDHTYDHI